MSTQTLPGHDFPTPCKRCGGALYRQVDYCPYCGAVHPLDAGPHKRIVMPQNGMDATSKAAASNGIAHTAHDAHDAHADVATHMQGFVLPDAPIPPLTRPPRAPGDRRGPSTRMVLMAIAAVVVVGLAYVGYALFGGAASSQGDNVANEPVAKSSAGAVAAYAPAASVNASAAATAPADLAAVTASRTANLKAASTPPYRDASQALQAARAALRDHDLSVAQNALSAAQTLHAGNADMHPLQNELDPLAARRDAALQAAQTCAAQQQWACVRQHAADALTLDSGSIAAGNLLERAIREAGWTPLGSHDAATPARAPTAAPASSSPVSPAEVQLAPLPGDQPPAGETLSRATTPRASGGRSGGVDARAHTMRESSWRRSWAKHPGSALGTFGTFTNPAPVEAPNAVAGATTTTIETIAAPVVEVKTPPAATAARTPIKESDDSPDDNESSEKSDSSTPPDNSTSSP